MKRLFSKSAKETPKATPTKVVAPVEATKFGTFLGVYLPSLLTILGLIMYLRFGWVVGNVGLGLTLLIVLLASSITFITGLSASAIATNMLVGAGGEYYMISRSLGLELGGAIGIPLYLCRVLSITFYCFGLAEAIVIFLPDIGLSQTLMVQLVAAFVVIITTLLSSKSASLVLKLQVPILIAVGLSVLALIIGLSLKGFQAPDFEASYQSAPQGFWYVFAVFFPAVTGFTAGIGMSGDLKDPQKSIPLGTMGAIITGLVLYLLIPIFLSISKAMTPEQLANSGVETWTKVAIFGGILVYPAIWGAILSSAFGSVLSGPRVLQALAKDGLAPKMFTKVSKTGEPVRATLISGGIALLAVALGGLNTVAQFVSILFLTLYVMINLSAVVEKLVGDPSYRPTINVPWYISVMGAIGAILVMFLISPIACFFAILFELALYLFLQRRTLQKQWGDVRAGFWFVLARYALVNHRPHGSKARNWRPSILVFVSDVAKEIGLLRLASWLSHKSGIVTATHLEEGDLMTSEIDIESMQSTMNEAIMEEKLPAFSEVILVKDFESGAIDAAQANGIAGIKSNTVLFGWTGDVERLASILRIASALSKANISTIIANLDWGYEPGQVKQIDLWWGGVNRNGDLMLLFAHLLNSNAHWNDARITIRSIVENKAEKSRMEDQFRAVVPRSRIKATVAVIIRQKEERLVELIHKYSQNATITFIGLKVPDPGTELEYAKKLKEISAGLKTTILVHNGERNVPVLLSMDLI